jgi:hypothetical protein
MRRRRAFLAPVVAGVVGAMAFATTAPAGAQEGEANGIRAVVEVIGGTLTTIPNTPHQEQPPGGSTQVASLPGTAAPAATAGILTAAADGSGSSASVLNLTAANGVVPGFTSVVTADAVTSECSFPDGSSAIANGVAAGVPVALSPPPNTTIPIPGVGQLVLNEQISDSGGITVRAIHLVVNVPGIVGAEVVVSESVCLAGIEALAAEATAGTGTLTG